MADSASLKIKRASKHIRELTNLLNKERPFKYIMETNTVTLQRSLMAKKNITVISEAGDIAADAIHNLRVALDHAYFEIAAPFAKGVRGIKGIQFPFSETLDGLEGAAKNRIAHKVGDKFFRTIITLKPYGESGGNELLYAIHALDAVDKHRFPIPTSDYKRFSSQDIWKLGMTHFPSNMTDVAAGMCVRDVVWSHHVAPNENIGRSIFPTTFMFEKELSIPVDIVFEIGSSKNLVPIIPTLNAMVDVTKETINIIRTAAV